MELPLCLIFIEDDIIVDVNSTFDSTVGKLYDEYKKSYVIGKRVDTTIIFHDKDYCTLAIGNYRLYAKFTLVNNIIALCCCLDSDVIDSNYFIHSTLTPLTNVVELVKMIDKTQLSTKEKEYINVIKKNNFELIKNINDITSFLTYFNKGVVIHREDINLYKKIHEVIQIISNIYKISIVLDVSKLAAVTCDKQILFDTLYHMLFWLTKYIEDDTIVITCTETSVNMHCKSFSEDLSRKLKNCIIHKYKHTDSLDVHIIKLLCYLYGNNVEYNQDNYVLSFAR